MKRVYVDSNVLIALYAIDKTEETKKKLVESALDAFGQLADVQLWASTWVITEMVNILVSQKKMNRGNVAEIENQLVNEKRLRNLKICLCEVSPRKDYYFTEFFFHVRQGILRERTGPKRGLEPMCYSTLANWSRNLDLRSGNSVARLRTN